MFKDKRIYAIAISMATFAALTGVAFALVQIAREVDASVDVTIIAPEGIEVYLDEALTEFADSVDFGTVDVDPFGSLIGEVTVPIWVRNVSLSDIRLSLSDDLDGADVILMGEEQNPVLAAGEVLPRSSASAVREPQA